MKIKPHIRWSMCLRKWVCSLPGGRRGQVVSYANMPDKAYRMWATAKLAEVQGC